MIQMKSTNEKIQVEDNQYCKIFVEEFISKQFNIYLNDAIDDQIYYMDALHILRTVSPEDNIRIYINNVGGSIGTTIQILNAMLHSQATITTILDGEASSAAGLIFLAGDEFEVYPNSRMLCHYYSSGIQGKGNELESYVDFTKKNFHDIFRKFYANFLDAKEIESLFDGRDIYLGFDEITKRLKKLATARNKQSKSRKNIKS